MHATKLAIRVLCMCACVRFVQSDFVTCTDFYLEKFWCYWGYTECCYDASDDASDNASTTTVTARERSVLPSPAPKPHSMPCSLNVYAPDSNTNLTFLYFTFRRHLPMFTFASNNEMDQCMCLKGYSNTPEGNFSVQFHDGNCSLSEGTCTTGDPSVICDCSNTACSCDDYDLLNVQTKASKTNGPNHNHNSGNQRQPTPGNREPNTPGNNGRNNPGNQGHPQDDNCSIQYSEEHGVDLGKYITKDYRICYPTSEYRQVPCSSPGDAICTMAVWVFCLCQNGDEVDVCGCKSGSDYQRVGNVSTVCTSNDAKTNVPDSGKQIQTSTKVAIGVGVTLLIVVIILATACFMQKKNGGTKDQDNERNKERQFNNDTYTNNVQPNIRIGAMASVHEYASIPNILSEEEPASNPDSSMYAEPDANIIVTPEPASNPNSSTYAEPDPNIIVTPSGAVCVTDQTYSEPETVSHEQPNTTMSDDQPRQNDRKGANTYEDMINSSDINNDDTDDKPQHSSDINDVNGNTYDKPKPTINSLSVKDDNNDNSTNGKSTKLTDEGNYSSPRPPYAKVQKIQEQSRAEQGLENTAEGQVVGNTSENTESYGQLQATMATDDSAYQKLDRGLDIRMK